jgi:hypothetical protein
MKSIRFSKIMSIKNTTSATSREAVKTTIELLTNSDHVGQVTLLISSSYELLIFSIIFIILFVARVERLELPTPGFGDQCSTKLS